MTTQISGFRRHGLTLCALLVGQFGVYVSSAGAQAKLVVEQPGIVAEQKADAAKPADGEALQKISRKLLSPAKISADKAPLAKFAADLAKQYEIQLRVDDKAIEAAGVKIDQPITADIQKGTLGQALTKVLKERNLRWEMRDTEVVITAGAKVAEQRQGAVVTFTTVVAQPAPPVEQPKVDPEMLQKISRKLLAAADIQAEKQPLERFIADLAKQYEIPIRVDAKTIKAAGARPDAQITASIKKGTLGQGLTTVLKERGLRWELRDTEVVITSIAKPAPPAAPVAAKRPAAAAQAVQLVQAQQQAEQQFIPQFRVLWRSEMHFIGKVCQPSEEQVTKLNKEAAERIKAASAQFVRSRSGARRVVNGVVVSATGTTEPRAILQDALKPTLEATLTADQLAKYKVEVDQSRTARRDMVVQNIVSKFDRDLQLSADQRDKLSTSLAENWESAWSMSPQALMNLDNFFPSIPDKLVVPTLNERQQKIWRAAQKQDVRNFFGGFGLFGNEIDESVWEDAQAEGGAAVLPPDNPPGEAQ